MKLSKQATERIADATARAVKSRPAGLSELNAVIAAAVGAATREILDLVSKEIDPLKQRKAMVFQGAHVSGERYEIGATVQRGGHLHVCVCATYESPGSSASWRRVAVRKD